MVEHIGSQVAQDACENNKRLNSKSVIYMSYDLSLNTPC